MDEFIFRLQDLISKNKIQQVIKILLETFQKCETKHPLAKEEVRDLRNQVVLLSARYNDTTDKINSGIINPLLADTAKNQLLSSFLNIASKLRDYPEFTNYINGLEEEEAWEAAVKANNIETYRVFFNQYPNGKYKQETQKVISELEAIQKAKEKEIKQKAEEEKARRVREEKRQKEEAQLKKEASQKAEEEKAQQEAARKEAEREKEVAALKEKLEKKAKLIQEQKEALAKTEEEKRRVLQEKETLAKAEKEKAAQENKKIQQTLQDKKEPEKKSAKASTSEDQVTSAAANVAAIASQSTTSTTTEKKSLFSTQNILWTLLPFTLAPIAGWILGSTINDWYLFAWIYLPLAYGLTAYFFPLRKKWYSLISMALSSVMGLGGALLSDIIINDEEYILLFGLIFATIAIPTFIILFFRSRSLDKNNSWNTVSERNFFSKQNKWWSFLAFPISIFLGLGGMVLSAFLGIYSAGLFSPYAALLLVIAYCLVAFNAPLQPQIKSLISIAIASFFLASIQLFLLTGGMSVSLSITEFLTSYALNFMILAIPVNLILLFQNRRRKNKAQKT